ncbi:hypothetical protein, partial [Agromyces humatus]|uniref:hypothetical protein n=1 Tax=Agromyces humatus TaxID=279573 RepID=UPI001E5EEC1F
MRAIAHCGAGVPAIRVRVPVAERGAGHRAVPECPSARVPECPSARVPECPSARVPECPSARVPE